MRSRFFVSESSDAHVSKFTNGINPNTCLLQEEHALIPDGERTTIIAESFQI